MKQSSPRVPPGVDPDQNHSLRVAGSRRGGMPRSRPAEGWPGSAAAHGPAGAPGFSAARGHAERGERRAANRETWRSRREGARAGGGAPADLYSRDGILVTSVAHCGCVFVSPWARCFSGRMCYHQLRDVQLTRAAEGDDKKNTSKWMKHLPLDHNRKEQDGDEK